MNSEEVRRCILKDHTQIRELLDEIAAFIQSFEKNGAEPEVDALRKRGLRLYSTLAEHLTREDEILVPILRTTGPDGLARARQLGREHRVQRKLLEFLTDRLTENDVPTIHVVRQLKNFTDYLRFDMLHEEQSIITG